jgi:phosphoenolpyruvate-protein kinase (PTS system EI component)
MTAQSVQPGLIDEGDKGRELSRFRSALQESESQLSALHKKVREGIGAEAAEVFTAQALIPSDSYFIQRVSALIETHRMNLEAALREVIGQVSQAFAMMEDPYIRERAADIRDAGPPDSVDSGLSNPQPWPRDSGRDHYCRRRIAAIANSRP